VLGALNAAEQCFQALCAKYGAPFLTAASAALLDYAERWMRAEIAAIPDGIYEFEDYLEDDGVQASPLRMRVKVAVAGERFTADYTASDRQARGPINATRGVTISATLTRFTSSRIRLFRATPGAIAPSRFLPAPAAAWTWRFQPRPSAATPRRSRESCSLSTARAKNGRSLASRIGYRAHDDRRERQSVQRRTLAPLRRT
jgi:N-methylhydantoinase B